MAAVLNRVTKQYLPSANTPDYPAQDWIVNPDLSAVVGFAAKYWVISGDSVTLMTQGERDAVDAAEAQALRDEMASDMDRPHPRFMRAYSEAMVSEFNAHAAKVNAILDAIDGATSLATLKTAVAAISDHPTRTLAQLKNTVRNNLDG